jgi:predicted nucleotide-binding protein (sugar kinase/HSP70/actin superfamily)
MVKVGIPRALLYYQYYPMWRRFFEGLGAEVIVSPPTTQAVLAAGSSRVVADTCLPVKAYCGHVLALVDKCDCVFIPALRSIKRKIFNCSKFLGLPDMTRAVIPECPPILDIDIDINKGKRKLYQAIYRLGRHFSRDPLRIRRAALAAWQVHQEYKELMVSQGLTPPQAIARISGEQTTPTSPNKAAIALVGHPYLLYDELINHRLIHRLEQSGYRVLAPEMLNAGQLGRAIAGLMGRPYWTYEEEVVGSGGHYLEAGVDGVIGVVAFGCGPDSLMMDMVQRQAIKLGTTPFMSLTLEEHTAEAGIITRLEAFLDMIERRKRKGAEVCL